MKAAFIDPQLRVLYYPTYDVIVCSDGETSTDVDVDDDNDDEG